MRPSLPIDRRKLRSPAWISTFFLALCFLHIGSSGARADSVDSLRRTLRVHSGATCVSVETLLPQVELWLRSAVLSPGIAIDVEGSASDPRDVSFRVLRYGEVLAHRTFNPGPAQCEYLQAALGLAIALALKVSLLDDLSQPLPDDPSTRDRGWSLTAALAGTFDALPGVAPGLELRTQLALSPLFALRLGALGLGGFGKTLDHTSEHYDAGLFALQLDACVRTQLARDLELGVCTGFMAGAFYVHGRALPDGRGSVVAWSALVNGANLRLALSTAWSLGLDASIILPLRRVRVGTKSTSGDIVDAEMLSTLGVVLAVGPSYHF